MLLAAAAGGALLIGIGAGFVSADELEQKAAQFRRALVERHLAKEGVVLYRMHLPSAARDLARGAYPNLADTPTFTGLFAAASCTRASVASQRGEALADAERALAGLQMLMEVTGEPGLLARGIRRVDAGLEGMRGVWLLAAPPHEGWRYRGDASADQYANGLLPAIAACRSFFPDRARRLATAFADHLIRHDLLLTTRDGQPTRFSDLSPGSGAGLNSIYQLTGFAAFALAAELTQEARFAHWRDRLRDRDRVLERARTTNLRIGALTNHSNDLMAWNLYRVLLPLARRTADPGLADLRHGMHRTWLRVRGDGVAYFAIVHCFVEPESCDERALEQARDQLRRFPLDKRRRGPDPSLANLSRRWLPDRKGRPLARRPVPIELRSGSSLEWKSSPYRVSGAASLETQYTGVDYLVAYWLLRLVDEASKR